MVQTELVIHELRRGVGILEERGEHLSGKSGRVHGEVGGDIRVAPSNANGVDELVGGKGVDEGGELMEQALCSLGVGIRRLEIAELFKKLLLGRLRQRGGCRNVGG